MCEFFSDFTFLDNLVFRSFHKTKGCKNSLKPTSKTQKGVSDRNLHGCYLDTGSRIGQLSHQGIDLIVK